MKTFVFNSYPRSASTYLRHIFVEVFGFNSESIHLPEVLSADYLNQISVFRKPEDSIASFIMMKHPPDTNPGLKLSHIKLSEYIELYRKYMFYAEKHKNSIVIAKFDNIINNELLYFEYISERFSIPLMEDYELKFKSMNFNHTAWQDPYRGSYPRKKMEDRISIENELNNIDLIKELNNDYMEFISKNDSFKHL